MPISKNLSKFFEEHFGFLLKLNRFVTFHLLLVFTLTLISTWLLSGSMMNNINDKMTQNDLREEVDDSNRALRSELSALNKTTLDYARWNEAYDAVTSGDKSWIKLNCTEWLTTNFGVSAVGVFDHLGRLIESPQPEIIRMIPQSVLPSTITKSTIHTGVTELNGRIYLVSYASIVDGMNTKPPVGTLVIMKALDTKFLNTLNEHYKVCMVLSTPSGLLGSDDFVKSMTPKMASIFTQTSKNTPLSTHNYRFSNTLYGRYFTVPDLFSKVSIPVMVIRDISDRVAIMNYMDRSILLLGLGITAVMMFTFYIINRYITRPIELFSKSLHEMSSVGRFKKLEIQSNISEVKSLFAAFNDLSDNLQEKEWENNTLMRERYRDPLTGLFNHGFFHNYIDKSSGAFERLHILFLDIDNFKMVNDTYGHKSGDLVLEEVAFILKEVVGPRGMAIRYGGEEFLAVMINSHPEKATEAGDNIRNAVLNNPKIQACKVTAPVTVSIGIAEYPRHATSLDEVVRLADMAMYYSKNTGKNRTVYYDERIETFMSSMNTNLLRMNMGYIRALADAIDSKINIKPGHSQKVMDYSLIIAEALDFSKEELDDLKISALLHDCGKISIPDQLFMKKEPLTSEEFLILMGHASLGYDIMAKATNRKGILEGIRHHHERFDGQGYPDGLKGLSIPLNGRIISVANALHTMQCDLPYKTSLDTARIKEELQLTAGSYFDPEIVSLAIDLILDGDPPL